MINSNYHYLLWHCYIVKRYWAPAERRHSKFWWWWWWWWWWRRRRRWM